MKILAIADTFLPKYSGGAEHSTYIVLESLARQGMEIEVLTTTPNPEDEGTIEFNNFPIHYISNNYPERYRNFISLNNPPVVSKVKLWLKKIRPDIVQIHNIHQYISYKSLEVISNAGLPIFYTAHDAMAICSLQYCHKQKSYPLKPRVRQLRCFLCQRFRYNPWRNYFIRHYLNKYCNLIFCNSRALLEILGVNGIRNTAVLYNAINLEQFTPVTDQGKLAEFSKKYEITQKPLFLHSGRLGLIKGTDSFLEAFAKIASRFKNAPQVLLVGAKKGQKRLSQKAMDLGIGSLVRFAPWLSEEDMRCAYTLCDVVVVPSIFLDAFPRINLEAGAMSKPVIGTLFGGTPEIITDGENGFLVNPHDLDQFGEKLYQISIDPDLRTRMGKKARERVERDFTPEHNARTRIEYYKSCVKN